MLSRFQSLFRNWVSIVGAMVATIAALLFIAVFVLDLFGLHHNPYIGIIFFLIIPAVFIVGLLLIPIGIYLQRRRQRGGRTLPSEGEWPRLDLNSTRTRRVFFAVVVLTIANVLIVSLAAYRGMEEMDSVRFCGQVCHQVMQPEYVAHQYWPHAKVACAQCHVGPGAKSFVNAKLNGLHQVYGVVTNSYSRPIPTPVEQLRSANEICEQCHWPQRFVGDKVRVIREFAEDEKNTETVTTVQLHVGGGSPRPEVPAGVHWHVFAQNRIEYVATDDKRQEIGYVRLTGPDGSVKEFYAEGVTPEKIAGRERRVMDCMDCHNRPAHRFDPSAERAVDEAIASGAIAASLPFARRETAAAVKESYPDQQVAAERIADRLTTFYRTTYPDVYNAQRADVERTIRAAQAVYARNVFPSMKVNWGTYPNNIGHIAFPGCFRCHDESHKAADGTVIRQDCEMCHSVS
jgi:hypothetical protein